jgi:hypothetical protein
MKVIIKQFGHRCHNFVGEAEPAFEGENLRQEFKDMLRVKFAEPKSHGIKSITINKKHCQTL